jgi:hypothetical protein
MGVSVRRTDHVDRLARAGLDHVTFQREVDEVLRAAIAYEESDPG